MRRYLTANVARRRDRVLVALGTGIVAAGLSLAMSYRGAGWFQSDFDQIWRGAHALLAGENPYRVMIERHQMSGPLFYPMPALLVGMPLTVLPLVMARAAFAGIGVGALGYAMLRSKGPAGLLWLSSAAVLNAVLVSQWSPLLVAGTILPWAACLWIAKPSIGLACFIARPQRAALLAGLTLLLLSVALRPWWIGEWANGLRQASDIRSPMTRPFGWLLMLAVCKWRRPEARLLAVLAAVPQTSMLYEAVPLGLIPRSRRESLWLVAGTWVAWGWTTYTDHSVTLREALAERWPVMLLLVYLPALVMVLRRPNIAEDTEHQHPLAVAA